MIITSSLVYAALALFALMSNHPPLPHHFPESIKATLSTFAPKLLSGHNLERLWVHFPYLRPPTPAPVDVFAPLAFSPRLFEPHMFEWCDPSSAPPPATRVFGMLFGSKMIEVTNATVSLQVLTAIIAFFGVLLALGTLLTCSRAGPRLPVTETTSMIDSLGVEPCKLPASISATSVLEDSVASTVSPSASTLSASDSFTTAILISSVTLPVSDSTDSFLSYVEPAELGAQSVPASASLSESVSSHASITSLATPAPVTPTTPTTTDPSPWIEVRSRSPTPSRPVLAAPRPTPKAPATTHAGSFRNSFAALQNFAQEDTRARPAPPPPRAPARTESRDARGKSNRRQTKDARPAPPPAPARPAQQRGTNNRQKRQNKNKSVPQTTRTQTVPQTRKDAPAPKAPRPGPSTASTSRSVAKPRTPATKTQSRPPKASSAPNKQQQKPKTAPSPPPPQQSASNEPRSAPRSDPPADTNLSQPPSSQDASAPETSPRSWFIVGHETHRIQDCDRRNANAKNKPITSSSIRKQKQQSSSQKEQQYASSSQQQAPAQPSQPAQQQDQRERPVLSPMRMTDLRTLLMTERLAMPQSERRRQQRAVAGLLGPQEQSSTRASLVGVGYAVRPRKMRGKGKEREGA
ncbi:hypothetical protein EIP86_007289 [Pleurotus ostreatoroseus]|nr:hypothetical protein EIP86_007289 [Pleurotus ostreatoroseus]